jgi:hypothetical protein
MRRLLALVVLAALVGAVWGLFVPTAEAIWAVYYLKVQPGTPKDDPGVLTCGWHSGACPNDASRTAIDWDDYGGSTVYWRSYLFMQYAQHDTVVARGYSTQYDTAICYRTRVRVVHYLSGQSMGRVYYTHTISNSATVSIKGSGSGWSYSKGSVAAVADPEMTDDCPWGGTHIHQGDDDNYFSESPTFPWSTECNVGMHPPCTKSYDVTASDKWQFYGSGRIQY